MRDFYGLFPYGKLLDSDKYSFQYIIKDRFNRSLIIYWETFMFRLIY